MRSEAQHHIFDSNRVPILYWNQNIARNNFANWRDKIIIYASMNYQHITHILENDEEYPIPVLTPPTPIIQSSSTTSITSRKGDKTSDDRSMISPYFDEIEKIEYVEALRTRNALISKIESEKLPFFTLLMEHLSESSKTILI